MRHSPFFKIALVILGSALFSISTNYFIVPMGLYNGGLLGFAQLLRTLLITVFHLDVPFDIAGIINLMFNIPLFLLAYRSISRKFVMGTAISVLVQSILMTWIAIPSAPPLTDAMANLLVGASLGAVGCGICLFAEASAGGMDILGMYISIKHKGMAVGRISIYVNVTLYTICALVFNLQTALYSIIYAIFFGIVEDKVHLQNIDLTVMIFTKKENLAQGILHDMHRGVTQWKGEGAYTHEDTTILVTVISKYELDTLRQYLNQQDPSAFIIIQGGPQVSGGYDKRLIHS